MVPLFEVDRVSVVANDGAMLLRDIGLTIHDTGITAIVGESGAGKSTLLRLLNRLASPTTGTVAFRATPLTDIDVTDLRRRIAMLFQRAPVFPGTALESLRLARHDLTADEAEGLMDRAHLDASMLDQEVASLSGGEAQRLSVARALVNQPEVVLADEPTASLDGRARRRLEDLARELAEADVPVVWVTHDTDQLRRVADRAVALDDGSVLANGSLDALQRSDDPRVRALLGPA